MKRLPQKLNLLRNKIKTFEWSITELTKPHTAATEGSVAHIIDKNIATIQPSNTIKHVADAMAKSNSRRVFVTDPNQNLRGIVTAKDIVDFLGGGERFNLVKEKHGNNLTAAINEDVREIMDENVRTISIKDSAEEAASKIEETGFGAVGIVDENKIVGHVRERDVIRHLSKQLEGKKVKDCAIRKVVTGTSGMKLSDIAKVMVRNGFRRIPIIEEGELVGIVTTYDIVKEFSDNFSENLLGTKVSEIMRKPVTVSPEDDLQGVVTLFVRKNIGGAPVIENGKIVGLVTERDIVNCLSEV